MTVALSPTLAVMGPASAQCAFAEDLSMPHAPTAAWLDRFTMRLGQLLPSLTIDEAGRIALSTFPDAEEIDPDEAADIYALEPPDADAKGALK